MYDTDHHAVANERVLHSVPQAPQDSRIRPSYLAYRGFIRKPPFTPTSDVLSRTGLSSSNPLGSTLPDSHLSRCGLPRISESL